MSIKGSFNAECPGCGETFEAEFWSVVRGDKDQDLKEALIGGEFDMLMCPGCSNIFPCQQSFVYMDPEKELLVFVMPAAAEAEREKSIARMTADYESLRSRLPGESPLSVPPLYHFGTEALSELLLRDRDMEEETEVMAFMAGERGFKTAPIRASFARERDLPFALPFAGSPTRENALKAVRAIVADNDALVRANHLLRVLEEQKTQDLPFLIRGNR